MSFEGLPESLEKGVNLFAQEHHMTREEALVQLIESGLHARGKSDHGNTGPRIPGLPRRPLSEEDCRIMDEAMELVMEARLEESERLFRA